MHIHFSGKTISEVMADSQSFYIFQQIWHVDYSLSCSCHHPQKLQFFFLKNSRRAEVSNTLAWMAVAGLSHINLIYLLKSVLRRRVTVHPAWQNAYRENDYPTFFHLQNHFLLQGIKGHLHYHFCFPGSCDYCCKNCLHSVSGTWTAFHLARKQHF